ncbi:hypothetical protein BC829DRAFT_221188 [Chytridium lagenaria]|nr:hypothetical protein BC829DRAFT_221188 [Chytridium lagenaria]
MFKTTQESQVYGGESMDRVRNPKSYTFYYYYFEAFLFFKSTFALQFWTGGKKFLNFFVVRVTLSGGVLFYYGKPKFLNLLLTNSCMLCCSGYPGILKS